VIEVLPNNSGDHGQDWLNKWNLLEGPFDTVIFHYDAWVLGGFRPPEGMRLLWYSPVDHSPVPPPLVNTLKGGGTVVAMSRFAEEELKKAGIVSIYVPHAFDPSIYHPGDRIEARKRLELPEDCFLIACIARNTGPRKNLGNMLRAFRDFLWGLLRGSSTRTHSSMRGSGLARARRQTLTGLPTGPSCVCPGDKRYSLLRV